MELRHVGSLSKLCGTLVICCEQGRWPAPYLVNTSSRRSSNKPQKTWDESETYQKHAQRVCFARVLLALSARCRACEKILARLVRPIHHTAYDKQCYHVGHNAMDCKVSLFPDLDLGGSLRDSKSTPVIDMLHPTAGSTSPRKTKFMDHLATLTVHLHTRDNSAGSHRCTYARTS